MPRHTILRWTGALLLLCWAVEPAPGMCKPDPMSASVPEFHARNLRLIEAVFELGRSEGICFGIEAMDEALLRKRIDLDRYRSNAKALLAEILGPATELEVVEAGGVLLVRRKTRPEYSWLNYSLPVFRSQQADIQSVSNLIYMTMATVAQPGLQGFAGTYPAGDPADVIGPFHEEHKTVGELLSLILRNSRGGMWVVEGNTAFEKHLPRKPFWSVIQYSQPKEIAVERLHQLTVTPAFPSRAPAAP